MNNRIHIFGTGQDKHVEVWLDTEIGEQDGLVLASAPTQAEALMAAAKEAEDIRDRLAQLALAELIQNGRTFSFRMEPHVEVKRS